MVQLVEEFEDCVYVRVCVRVCVCVCERDVVACEWAFKASPTLLLLLPVVFEEEGGWERGHMEGQRRRGDRRSGGEKEARRGEKGAEGAVTLPPTASATFLQ